jgi:hypothetical protein
MKRAAWVVMMLLFPLFSLCQPQNGFLQLLSNPDGATVTINGRSFGATPLFLSLRPGSHEVLLTLKNYEPKVLPVNIRTKEVSKYEVDLRELKEYKAKIEKPAQVMPTGKLTVITTPPGASVRLDGLPVDSPTPFTLEGLWPGIHEVVIRTTMGEPIDEEIETRKTVDIRATEPYLLQVDLPAEAPIGVLSITSNLTGKPILLVNESTGKRYALTMPAAKKMVQGSYTAEWTDVEENRLRLQVLPNRSTLMYLPFREPLLRLTSVQEQPGYVDEETYIRNSGRLLPEVQEEQYTNVKGWNVFLGLSSLAVSIALVSTPPPEDSDPTLRIGGSVLFAALGVAGILNAFPSELRTVESPQNIAQNERTRRSLSSEYQVMLMQWQSDTEKENAAIQEQNKAREERNKLIGAPYVELR